MKRRVNIARLRNIVVKSCTTVPGSICMCHSFLSQHSLPLEMVLSAIRIRSIGLPGPIAFRRSEVEIG